MYNGLFLYWHIISILVEMLTLLINVSNIKIETIFLDSNHVDFNSIFQTNQNVGVFTSRWKILYYIGFRDGRNTELNLIIHIR